MRNNRRRQPHRTSVQAHSKHRETYHGSYRNTIQRVRLPNVRSSSQVFREHIERDDDPAIEGGNARRHTKGRCGTFEQGVHETPTAHDGHLPASVLWRTGEAGRNQAHSGSYREDKGSQRHTVH